MNDIFNYFLTFTFETIDKFIIFALLTKYKEQ